MADIKFIENIKSKFSLPPENDKIYITVLLKLVIYEQLCRFSSRIIDEKFLHNSRTHDKQTFLEVARGIMNITELVSVNDWKKYFNKYFDELKIIFPSFVNLNVLIHFVSKLYNIKYNLANNFPIVFRSSV